MSRSRNEFTGKVKIAAWERCGGFCEECGVKIWPGNGPEYDHIVPDAIGGKADLENCKVLCRPCHGAKTAKADVPMIAKVKRVARKHIGAKTPSRNPLPGGRNSKERKKINGTVERRE